MKTVLALGKGLIHSLSQVILWVQMRGGVTHLIPNAPTFPTLLSAVILAPRECAEELTRLVAIQEGQKPPSLPKLVLLTP